jgi:solute carrier family 39 (zinc transporter), member 1/2/3
MSSKSVRNVKIGFFFVFLIVSMAGVLPIKLKSLFKSEAGLSYLNCFSAGLFLAIAAIHLMPEAVHEHQEYAEHHGIERPFPLTFCMMLLGYLLVLLVDKVMAQRFLANKSEEAEPSTIEMAAANVQPTDTEKQQPVRAVQKATVSRASCIILVIALVVHSFIEGVAVGIQETFDFALFLAISVAIHKLPTAISLGGTLTRSDFTFWKGFGLVFAFAVATPIGLLIGMGLESSIPLAAPVLNSLSAGTFIYVSCSEILVYEFGRGLNKHWL